MQTINDWRPETTALITALIAAGFNVTGWDNGEENGRTPNGVVVNDANWEAFLENLLATDETHLCVTKNGFERRLFLVLGNSPGELVSDYSMPNADEPGNADLDAVTEAHYALWNEKEQPKRTGFYLRGKFVDKGAAK